MLICGIEKKSIMLNPKFLLLFVNPPLSEKDYLFTLIKSLNSYRPFFESIVAHIYYPLYLLYIHKIILPANDPESKILLIRYKSCSLPQLHLYFLIIKRQKWTWI